MTKQRIAFIACLFLLFVAAAFGISDTAVGQAPDGLYDPLKEATAHDTMIMTSALTALAWSVAGLMLVRDGRNEIDTMIGVGVLSNGLYHVLIAVTLLWMPSLSTFWVSAKALAYTASDVLFGLAALKLYRERRRDG